MRSSKRRGFDKNNKAPEFEQRLLDLARVTRVVKGGRRFSFRATMVIGNRKGKVGVGVAKGSDVSDAINKAVSKAKKEIIIVKRKDATISFRQEAKFGAAKVFIKPAREGQGIVAGGAMRTVIELSGIKNITAKSLGSSSKINVARATILALSKLEGKRKEEMTAVGKSELKKKDVPAGGNQQTAKKAEAEKE